MLLVTAVNLLLCLIYKLNLNISMCRKAKYKGVQYCLGFQASTRGSDKVSLDQWVSTEASFYFIDDNIDILQSGSSGT